MEIYSICHRKFMKASGHVKRIRRGQLQELALSPSQFMVLKNIGDKEAITISDISQGIQIENSNLTGIIDQLEEKGFVKRIDDAKDRRLKRLRLTMEGSKVREEALKQYERFIEKVYGSLPQHQMEMFIDILDKLENSIS